MIWQPPEAANVSNCGDLQPYSHNDISKYARDRNRTNHQNAVLQGDCDQTGAKSGAVDKSYNNLAAILVAIADLPAEQRQALAKLLTPAAKAENLP